MLHYVPLNISPRQNTIRTKKDFFNIALFTLVLLFSVALFTLVFRVELQQYSLFACQVDNTYNR